MSFLETKTGRVLLTSSFLILAGALVGCGSGPTPTTQEQIALATAGAEVAQTAKEAGLDQCGGSLNPSCERSVPQIDTPLDTVEHAMKQQVLLKDGKVISGYDQKVMGILNAASQVGALFDTLAPISFRVVGASQDRDALPQEIPNQIPVVDGLTDYSVLFSNNNHGVEWHVGDGKFFYYNQPDDPGKIYVNFEPDVDKLEGRQYLRAGQKILGNGFSVDEYLTESAITQLEQVRQAAPAAQKNKIKIDRIVAVSPDTTIIGWEDAALDGLAKGLVGEIVVVTNDWEVYHLSRDIPGLQVTHKYFVLGDKPTILEPNCNCTYVSPEKYPFGSSWFGPTVTRESEETVPYAETFNKIIETHVTIKQ